MTTKPKFYADFNSMSESTRDSEKKIIPLNKMGSLRELSNIGVVLEDGLKVIVYMDSDETEDIESDAEIFFCNESDTWVAELIGKIRDVPIHQTSVDNFRCVSCKFQLHETIKEKGLSVGDRCPNCGELIHKVIEPPNGF